MSLDLVYGQNVFSVNGTVMDSISKDVLEGATVALLNSKDSILIDFLYTTSAGNFEFNKIKNGQFILLVTYPGYLDYVERFALDSLKSLCSLGEIKLTLKARILEEVIVTGDRIALKIKGDTIEFDARAYKLHANAKVEDLLKQLPGMQIDRNGKITAQGQPISKVLVDGEEFFGDDPTLVTKNIRGDMVDKVLLYDKKSEQAALTGVDDGIKNKTIDIKLKEDKKVGYFGKADLGLGTSEYYQSQGMFNRFKTKSKIAGYGTFANTAKIGLGWEDNSKYSFSNSLQMFDDGSILLFNNSEDEFESFNGKYSGQGIPNVASGGGHYDSKWNNDKESVNVNYKVGSLKVVGENLSLTKTNTLGDPIQTSSAQSLDNLVSRHKLDVVYQTAIGLNSTLKVSFEGMERKNKTESQFATEGKEESGQLLYSSKRSIEVDGNQRSIILNSFWTYKLKKPGRVTSLNVNYGTNLNESDIDLSALNQFSNENGSLGLQEEVKQQKLHSTDIRLFNATLTFSETISKTLSAVASYGLSSVVNNSSRLTFNQGHSGAYNLLDSTFSSDYDLNLLTNQVGAFLNYNTGKTRLTVGSKISSMVLDQFDRYTFLKSKKQYLNPAPQITYQYRISNQKSLRATYNGAVRIPTLSQVQPLRSNDDPLNIVEGNSILTPFFSNSLNLSYNSFNISKGISVLVNGRFSASTNAIINNITIDTSGRRVLSFLNLNDKTVSSFGFSIASAKKLKNVDLSLMVTGSSSNTFTSVNGELSRTKVSIYTTRFGFSKIKPQKYEWSFSLNPNYNINESILLARINNSGWGLNSTSAFKVFLPQKVDFAIDFDYRFVAKTSLFNNNFNRMLINSSISKRFSKQENFKLSLSINDMLNRNNGFTRSVSDNNVSQTNYNTISRFLMASAIWDFNRSDK